MRADLRRALRLAVVALFVGGLAAAQLAQASHFLLVRHAFCEHGDLVHAGRASASVAVEREKFSQATPGDLQQLEHEHCDANAVRCEMPSAAIFVAPPVVLTFLVDIEARPTIAARALDVLDVAPKCSPPRA